MARKSNPLRAVGEGETPSPREPETLVEAADMDRRAFLVASRKVLAKQIDEGVPPAYIGRMISEMTSLDLEIRRIDAAEEQEAQRDGNGGARRSFDASAI